MIRFIIFSLIICISCDSKTDIVNPSSKTNNNIPTASLTDVGLNESLLDSMYQFLAKDSMPSVHSVLIIKDDKLVSENYYKGYDKDSRHDLRSAGKSITNILLGIAIEKGLIKSENASVVDLLPFKVKNNSSMKKQMQLKHLLTMTDGLYCLDCVRISQGRSEPMEYLIGLPMEHAPGTHWFYNDAIPSLVEYIVMAQAQMSMVEFMRENLYKPLNIQVADDYNINYLRPRDMAQLGLLYLNKGKWNEKQIVPEDWVEKSTIRQTDLAPYGYFWWVYSIKAKNDLTYPLYAARGNGGNDIVIFPEQNMLVVFTGDAYDAAFSNNTRLLKEFILPAVE